MRRSKLKPHISLAPEYWAYEGRWWARVNSYNALGASPSDAYVRLMKFMKGREIRKSRKA